MRRAVWRRRTVDASLPGFSHETVSLHGDAYAGFIVRAVRACYAAGVTLNSCLAHPPFRNHYHVCAFVMGPSEERALIDPFFVEGLRRGEKAVYYVDPAQRDEHEARLRTSAPSPDMVEVTTWYDAYFKGGSFDQDRMMEALEVMIRENAASGRPGLPIQRSKQLRDAPFESKRQRTRNEAPTSPTTTQTTPTRSSTTSTRTTPTPAPPAPTPTVTQPASSSTTTETTPTSTAPTSTTSSSPTTTTTP